jgi:hypothetical protein
MSRKIPNITTIDTSNKSYKLKFRSFVFDVLTDTLLVKLIPDEISVIESVFFRLVLKNKEFKIDSLQVDVMSDYVNVYLYNVIQPKERYSVSVIGNDIVITFIENITRLPLDVVANDFRIEGKFKNKI